MKRNILLPLALLLLALATPAARAQIPGQTIDSLPYATLPFTGTEYWWGRQGSANVRFTPGLIFSSPTLSTPSLVAPTIIGGAVIAPALSGTITGVYTLAGTPTVAAPTVSGPLTVAPNGYLITNSTTSGIPTPSNGQGVWFSQASVGAQIIGNPGAFLSASGGGAFVAVTGGNVSIGGGITNFAGTGFLRIPVFGGVPLSTYAPYVGGQPAGFFFNTAANTLCVAVALNTFKCTAPLS